MGQRHQVFVVSKDKEETKYHAFHNQWCYGTLPLRHLKRVIQYQAKTDDTFRLGSRYSTDTDMIRAILSCDPSEGFYSNYFDVLSEHINKKGQVCLTCGDNNDGITIIVADGSKRISYCFMFIGDFHDKVKGDLIYESMTPLSAEEYVSAYYEKSDEKWSIFKLDKLISFIDKRADLLTLKELRKLFPLHFHEKTEWEKIAKANPKDLPIYISSEYKNNRVLAARRLQNA